MWIQTSIQLHLSIDEEEEEEDNEKKNLLLQTTNAATRRKIAHKMTIGRMIASCAEDPLLLSSSLSSLSPSLEPVESVRQYIYKNIRIFVITARCRFCT